MSALPPKAEVASRARATMGGRVGKPPASASTHLVCNSILANGSLADWGGYDVGQPLDQPFGDVAGCSLPNCCQSLAFGTRGSAIVIHN